MESETNEEDTQDCLYFVGNSLGLQPKCANELIQVEMDKWAKQGAKGRYSGKFPWMPIEDILVEESARIVDAKPVEVTVMNSLTVNVHLSMVSSLWIERERERERAMQLKPGTITLSYACLRFAVMC